MGVFGVGDDYFFTSCNGCNGSSDLANMMVIIRGSVGAFSFVTCVIAIGLFLCDLRLLRRFTYRLALYLVISAMFYSTVAVFAFQELRYEVSTADDVRFCKAAGFLLQYSDWIKLLLTTITTFHLLLFMVFHYNLESVLGLKFEIGCIIFSLVFPLLFIWYPFMNDTYGKAGAWCWIKTKDENGIAIEAGKIEQLAIWYGPFSVLLFLNTLVILLIILVLVCRSAHSQYKRSLPNDPAQQQLLKFSSGSNAGNKTTEHAHLLKLSLPLLAYPIVYQFLSFFAFADRLYRIVNNNPLLGLWFAHAIASASRGFFAGITLIVHLCLVKVKRSSYSVQTTPQTPRQLPAHDNNPPIRTRTNTGSRRTVGSSTRRSTLNPVTSTRRSVTSEVGNTTHYQAPRESEVDRAILQSTSHHDDVQQDENMTQNKEQTRDVNPVAIDEEDNWQERDLKQLDSLLTKTGNTTSDTAVTSDEEHVTRYRPPRESAVDDLLLKSKKPRGALAAEENGKKSPTTERLLKVEEQLEAEGYGTSDTGGATSDEDITTWRVPRESVVDEAALRKIV